MVWTLITIIDKACHCMDKIYLAINIQIITSVEPGLSVSQVACNRFGSVCVFSLHLDSNLHEFCQNSYKFLIKFVRAPLSDDIRQMVI